MDNKYSKEFVRTLILWLAGAIGVGALLLFPDKLYFEAIVYTIMLVISLTALVNFKVIQTYATNMRQRSPEKKLYGVGSKPFLGMLYGVIGGAGFLLLTKVKLFGAVITMAIPTLPLSLTGQGWVVTYIAPVVETIFFGVFLLSVLNLFMAFWIAVIIRAIVFSSYHYFAYVVYGSSTVSSVIGAFIGAFLFSIFGSLLANYIGSEADATAHATFNFVNFNSIYKIFSVIS